MNRVVKKIAFVLGIIASVLVIGTSVSGWINDRKDKTNDTTNSGTEVVQTVEG